MSDCRNCPHGASVHRAAPDTACMIGGCRCEGFEKAPRPFNQFIEDRINDVVEGADVAARPQRSDSEPRSPLAGPGPRGSGAQAS